MAKKSMIAKEGKPTRAGYDVASDGSKERIGRKSGSALPTKGK